MNKARLRGFFWSEREDLNLRPLVSQAFLAHRAKPAGRQEALYFQVFVSSPLVPVSPGNVASRSGTYLAHLTYCDRIGMRKRLPSWQTFTMLPRPEQPPVRTGR
jgi:hypothetical protein